MTAKPQAMAGQSDASDDLIAELAKLMAQDAQGDKPVQPSAPATVRIPGGDSAPPRFAFDPAPAAIPVVAQPAAPEPFNFDFDLGAQKAVSTESTAVPVIAPSSPIRPPVDPSFTPADHDSIADLIAAELLGEDEQEAPAPVAVAPAPPPAPEPPATRGPTSSWTPVSVAPNLGNQAQPQRTPIQPVNLTPAAKPEQDRFKVAPVFGLAAPRVEPTVSAVFAEPTVAPTPVRAEPALAARQPEPFAEPVIYDDGLGSDPIDEIESLIGEAVRVNLDAPNLASSKPAPSPALRSLATPTVATTSAATAPSGRKLSGADEAILAAAEATGVQIGWVDMPEIADAKPAKKPRRERAPREPREPRVARSGGGFSRAIAGPLVAVTLLLAAGFGLYWVLGLGGQTGPAPLLTADTTPTKETPVAETTTAATQQSVVFNEIDGVVPGAEEQLVSRDQADVNEVTQVPATTDVSEEGLANRKVRTVTVRPDGTIVSGEDSVAGSNILPVARPNVPDVPGAETASEALLASAEPQATTPTAASSAVVTPEPATTVTPVTPGATVPAVDTAGNALAGTTAVIPLVRPAGLSGPGGATSVPTSSVNAVVDTPVSGGNMLPPAPTTNLLGTSASSAAATNAATTPAATTVATTPSTTIPGATEVAALPNDAPAYVQLASQRTEDEARASAQALVTRYGPLFGGANMEVQRVDLGAKGIYYRVRVPASSAENAANICTNVKAAGGDCFTM